MILYRRIALVTALLALLWGLVAQTGASASQPPNYAVPAAGCNGATCNYQDPQAMGCNDSRTLSEFTFRGYRVEFRYSPACYAAWTRWTYVSGNAFSFTSWHETNIDGTIYRTVHTYGDGPWWTTMFSYARPARSCANSNTGSHCGPWQ